MAMQTQQVSGLRVSRSGLWFGFTAAASAWVITGLADTILAWRACFRNEEMGGAHTAAGWWTACILTTLLLLAIACVGGYISYRNLMQLANNNVAQADTAERPQFLALAGVYVSLTLGIGIVWFGLPLAVLHFCVRTR